MYEIIMLQYTKSGPFHQGRKLTQNGYYVVSSSTGELQLNYTIEPTSSALTFTPGNFSALPPFAARPSDRGVHERPNILLFTIAAHNKLRNHHSQSGWDPIILARYLQLVAAVEVLLGLILWTPKGWSALEKRKEGSKTRSQALSQTKVESPEIGLIKSSRASDGSSAGVLHSAENVTREGEELTTDDPLRYFVP